mmetsp:Transcript_9707/g.22751  ORF Transcript_9707/g.22751 Transcript_9707/m.22751 type:complete len:215 (-) Transcript_9707:207-851(-)
MSLRTTRARGTDPLWVQTRHAVTRSHRQKTHSPSPLTPCESPPRFSYSQPSLSPQWLRVCWRGLRFVMRRSLSLWGQDTDVRVGRGSGHGGGSPSDTPLSVSSFDQLHLIVCLPSPRSLPNSESVARPVTRLALSLSPSFLLSSPSPLSPPSLPLSPPLCLSPLWLTSPSSRSGQHLLQRHTPATSPVLEARTVSGLLSRCSSASPLRLGCCAR